MLHNRGSMFTLKILCEIKSVKPFQEKLKKLTGEEQIRKISSETRSSKSTPDKLHERISKFTSKISWKNRSLISAPKKFSKLTGEGNLKRYRVKLNHQNQHQLVINV